MLLDRRSIRATVYFTGEPNASTVDHARRASTMVRLDDLLSQVLAIKSSAGRKLVEAGEVTVAGEVQQDPHWQVVLDEQQHVCVSGNQLGSHPTHQRAFSHRLLLVHKPRACICERFRGSAAWCNARGGQHPHEVPSSKEAASIARGVRTIWDLVPATLLHPRLGVFGRLDVDTTGLILMGTDGGLQSMMTHPSSACEKAYIATLLVRSEGRLHVDAAEAFSRGILLADGHMCRPAKLEVLECVADPDGDEARPFARTVRVTLVEGVNHQVKRMLAACGAHVCALHRERIGGLSLASCEGLEEEGSVRSISHAEVAALQADLARMPRAARVGADRQARVCVRP